MHVVILAAAKHPLKQPFAGGLESLTWHWYAACGSAASTSPCLPAPVATRGSTPGRSPWHRWNSATPPEPTRPCRPSNG